MNKLKLSGFLYGGDYSPEQWPEETWQADLDLFITAGVNTLTLPVFAWARLQPDEDTYDFGWLDRFLDLLEKNSLYACLATPTAAQPAWLSRKYPDVLPVDVKGQKRSHGTRRNFCPNSPNYRKFSAKIAGEMAKRYAGHPALLFWHVSNEYASKCYCETCAKAFQSWLKKRHGTLDEVNKRLSLDFWGNVVTAWDQLVPPSELNDQAAACQGLALDYRRFMTDSLIACYLAEREKILEYSNDVPVTTNFTGLPIRTDMFEWAQHLDVIGWDNYPRPEDHPSTTSLKHDIMRGLKAGDPYFLMEQSPSVQNWLPYNTLRSPGEMRLLSYQAIAHGADSILMFQLKASLGGSEKYHGAFVSHSGKGDTRIYRECAELGHELSNLGTSIIGSRGDAEVAILFDWSSWWALDLSSGPSVDLDYFDQVAKYYRAFFESHIPVDIVPAGADLSSYKLVVAPTLYALDAGSSQILERYVSGGGTLIVSFFTGVVDANDRVVPGGAPALLKDVVGVSVKEIDALEPGVFNEVEIEGNWNGVKGRHRCGLICELLRLDTATSLARYGSRFYSGEPVVTVNSFGAGNAYYVATDLESAFLADLIKTICGTCEIEPPLPLPSGVEYTRRFHHGTEYSFLLNHNAEIVRVELPALPQRLLIGKVDKNAILTLDPFDVAILELKHKQ